MRLFSDWNRGLGFHMDYCKGVIALAELLGLKIVEIGIHGSVPTCLVIVQAGEEPKYGRLYEFSTHYGGVKKLSYTSSFDTTRFGIPAKEGTMEWNIEI